MVDVDENVHRPSFSEDVVSATISEGAVPHTLVTTVAALDDDSNPHDSTIVYSLIGSQGRGLFYIDHSGEYIFYSVFIWDIETSLTHFFICRPLSLNDLTPY